MKARRGSRHLLKAVGSRLFRAFAGQEVNYFEHYNGGNPVSQLQSSDFTKGLFFFSFYLKINIGWTPRWKTLGCPTISSALHCYQLSSYQNRQVVGSQRLTSTGFSKLFCTFLSSETKLGLQLYPHFLQGKSLYTIGHILVFPH